MKKAFGVIVLILCAGVVVASILTWPSPGTPRPLLTSAQVSQRVLVIIDRSCRDCHSDATRYPWYSYVFPVSLLISDDVKGGREHLNFSDWAQYSVIRRERALSEIANQVQDGGMPLSIYTWMHPSAKLSDTDVDAIFAWTQEERLRLIQTLRAPSSK